MKHYILYLRIIKNLLILLITVFCALHSLLYIPVSMEGGEEGGRKKRAKKRKKGGKNEKQKKERKISPCSERYYC